MAGIELNQALYGGLSPFLKRGIAAVSSSIHEDSTRLAPGPSDKGYRQGEGSVVLVCTQSESSCLSNQDGVRGCHRLP